MADVNLELLAKLCTNRLNEVKQMCAELADIRTLALQGIDYSRRLERRLAEQGDDLALVVKSEISGRFAMFESKMETALESLAERLEHVEGYSLGDGPH